MSPVEPVSRIEDMGGPDFRPGGKVPVADGVKCSGMLFPLPLTPFEKAFLDQKLADIALQFAKDEAEKIQAEAQRITANRALRDAVFAIGQSQVNLIIAMAEAAGDTVRVAELQLQLAKNELDNAIAEGAGAAEVNQLRASVLSRGI